MAGVGLAWWAILEPSIRRARGSTGLSLTQDWFEWLAGLFAEIMERAGGTLVFDDAYLRDSLERHLAQTRDMLQVEQSLRMVIVVSPDAETPPSPTAPAVPEG